MANWKYNGLSRPPLLNLELYPYQYMSMDGEMVFAFPKHPGVVRYIEYSNGIHWELFDEDGLHPSNVYYQYLNDSNRWQMLTSHPSPSGSSIWTNFDIYDENGKLVRRASAPIDEETGEEIDVYPNGNGNGENGGDDIGGGNATEPCVSFKPDPFSMTLGWLVGSRIAGQRGKA